MTRFFAVLAKARFDLFRKEKSRDDSSETPKEGKAENKLRRQKSIEGSTSRTGDYFKALSFRDKTKSASVRNVDVVTSSKQQNPASTSSCTTTSSKGVRKSDKTKDSDKSHKISFKSSSGKAKGGASPKAKEEKGANRDDFLKATMRIFLVVSPPVGKMQVNENAEHGRNFIMNCFHCMTVIALSHKDSVLLGVGLL